MSWVAGIGFTMSMFTSQLTFTTNDFLLNTAKLAVLIGSLLAGVVGYILMKLSSKKIQTDASIF